MPMRVNFAGPVHVVQLVSLVVILVVDEQVPIAVVVGRRQRVAFDGRSGGNRHEIVVAFVRIGVDDHIDPRLAPRNDHVGNADVGSLVNRPEVRMQRSRGADAVDQRRRVGGHRRTVDALVPGTVVGKKLIPRQRHQGPIFQAFQDERSAGERVSTWRCRRTAKDVPRRARAPPERCFSMSRSGEMSLCPVPRQHREPGPSTDCDASPSVYPSRRDPPRSKSGQVSCREWLAIGG